MKNNNKILLNVPNSYNFTNNTQVNLSRSHYKYCNTMYIAV